MSETKGRKTRSKMHESEEDVMDEKGVVKRKSRNLSEKKRRDQFNVLIGELCTMVCSGKRKMDKSTVLKTAIAFIQNHNQVSADLQGQEITEDWKPSFLSNEEFTHLILEALDGFILVFGIDGKILYSSENITSLLGHLPNELMGQNIYDFTLAEDKRVLAQILQHPDVIENSASDNPITFTCHLRRGTKPYVYEVVDITGYFKTQQGVRPCSPADSNCTTTWMDDNSASATCSERGTTSSVVFLASGRLQSPQLLSEKSLVDTKSEFTSRHSLEWKFLFLDHRAPPIIGYLPFEVLGTSGYDYYHVEDLEKVASAHEVLMQKGEGTSCYYRFLTKGQQWIWLQTRYYISYHQWNSKPEFIVCTHRVVSYNEVIGRPAAVRKENPASCLSTGGRPRNSTDSRSSSRSDREEGRAQLRSITKRTDGSRTQSRGKTREDARKPRSRASSVSISQQSAEIPMTVPPPTRESYPDSSAYTPIPPLKEDVPFEAELVRYEFPQPPVPVVAYKSEPRPETPQCHSQQYISSPSLNYRSSDRASVGSNDNVPATAPSPNRQYIQRQDSQSRASYHRTQFDQRSTGSNGSRSSDHRSSQLALAIRPPHDAVSVASSDSVKSQHSVQSESSARPMYNHQGRPLPSPSFERESERVRDEASRVQHQSHLTVQTPEGFVPGYPVPRSQLVQIRQGPNLVTVALPPGTVMAKNSSNPRMTPRRQDINDQAEDQRLSQRSPNRGTPVSQPSSHHVPVSFHSSLPMVVDMSRNSVPLQGPFIPFSVPGDSQRVQIIDGVPMMPLPMVRGMPQPMAMTAAQKQLHEQLQQKHTTLQRQLLQQQEELRKISEQLLFAQFGGWGPPMMTVQYEEDEPPSGASQNYRHRQPDRADHRSTVPVIQNIYSVRQDEDSAEYLQHSIQGSYTQVDREQGRRIP